MLEQVFRCADPIGIIECQIQILFVLLGTDVLTSDRHIDVLPLMGALGRTEQIPVGHTVFFTPNQIAAANVIPSEVLLSVHHLWQCKSNLLPSADLSCDGYIIRLAFGLQLGIILFTQLASVHIMN